MGVLLCSSREFFKSIGSIWRSAEWWQVYNGLPLLCMLLSLCHVFVVCLSSFLSTYLSGALVVIYTVVFVKAFMNKVNDNVLMLHFPHVALPTRGFGHACLYSGTFRSFTIAFPSITNSRSCDSATLCYGSTSSQHQMADFDTIQNQNLWISSWFCVRCLCCVFAVLMLMSFNLFYT